MKRKTSQKDKALSVCQTDLVVRSSIHEEEARNFTSCSFAMIALGWVGYFVFVWRVLT